MAEPASAPRSQNRSSSSLGLRPERRREKTSCIPPIRRQTNRRRTVFNQMLSRGVLGTGTRLRRCTQTRASSGWNPKLRVAWDSVPSVGGKRLPATLRSAVKQTVAVRSSIKCSLAESVGTGCRLRRCTQTRLLKCTVQCGVRRFIAALVLRRSRSFFLSNRHRDGCVRGEKKQRQRRLRRMRKR